MRRTQISTDLALLSTAALGTGTPIVYTPSDPAQTCCTPPDRQGSSADQPPRPTPILIDAEPINALHPEYPALSRRYREEGIVIVRVSIGKDGAAHHAQIHRSSGFRRLDAASLRAALSWKYRPATLAGVPQERWHDFPFRWELAHSPHTLELMAQTHSDSLSAPLSTIDQ